MELIFWNNLYVGHGKGKGKKKSCSCTVAVDIDTNCARCCLQGRPLAARYVAVRSILFLRPWQTAGGMFVRLEKKKKKEKRSLTAGKGRARQHLILCKYSDNIARQYSQDRCRRVRYSPSVRHRLLLKNSATQTQRGSAEITKGCARQALWDFLQGIWKFYTQARWLSAPGQSQRDMKRRNLSLDGFFLFKSHFPTVTGRVEEPSLVHAPLLAARQEKKMLLRLIPGASLLILAVIVLVT